MWMDVCVGEREVQGECVEMAGLIVKGHVGKCLPIMPVARFVDDWVCAGEGARRWSVN